MGYKYNPEWERKQSTLTDDAIATPLSVVYQDAPTEDIFGGLLLALLTSVMISVAVTMVMTPKIGIGR